MTSSLPQDQSVKLSVQVTGQHQTGQEYTYLNLFLYATKSSESTVPLQSRNGQMIQSTEWPASDRAKKATRASSAPPLTAEHVPPQRTK